MAARASTAALSFTVAANSTTDDMATSDADTMVMASAVVTNAEVAKEETSVVGTNAVVTREETSMVEAVPTAVGAGKFHFLAAPWGAHTRAR